MKITAINNRGANYLSALALLVSLILMGAAHAATTTCTINQVATRQTIRGLYCTCWDTPGQIFDWTTGAVLDQTQINALLGKSYVAPIPGL